MVICFFDLSLQYTTYVNQSNGSPCGGCFPTGVGFFLVRVGFFYNFISALFKSVFTKKLENMMNFHFFYFFKVVKKYITYEGRENES